MLATGRRLTSLLESVAPRLVAVADPAAPLARGKWSAKQLLGHLLDSCSVNHERFLRARGAEGLVFPGYPQDEWIELQGYQEAEWAELVELFLRANRRLAAVIARTPEDEATRPRARHNLHEIGWAPWPAGEPGTLAWLMADYIDHMQHHLTQLLPS
jgi:hypothetical protein